MGLYKTAPPLSGRMGALWCLAGVRESAVVEYGCMGHMVYGRTFLDRLGAQGSRLYSTHLGETDITMGDTGRLAEAVAQVVQMEDVRAVFLLASSTPEVSGVDLEAAARELAGRFPGIPLIPVGTGGFDRSGSEGVSQTLLCLAVHLAEPAARTAQLTCNLIGACPDLYNCRPDAMELGRIVRGAFHAEPLCCMTADTGISELRRLPAAHFNLVLRREGQAAAEYLQQQYGTPWLYARPYGLQGTAAWLEQAADQLQLTLDRAFVQAEMQAAQEELQPLQATLARWLQSHPAGAGLTLCGHPDVTAGIAQCAERELGFSAASRFCDDPAHADASVPFLSDAQKQALCGRKGGFLLGSGELLRMAGRDAGTQIALPDARWHHRYEPPLVGFRGAVSLAAMLVNALPRS